MRRGLTTALVGAVLVLTGCSGDEDPGTATTAPGDAPAATEGTGSGATDAPDGEEGTGSDGASATAGPGGEDGVEGGEEGQAAADVAKEFMLAMVDADPGACDYLLSFTDIERPMTQVSSDHEMCIELLPEVLRAEIEAQGLDPDTAAALEGLRITGADVDGDTAVVDADNYSEEFAAAMGGTTISLKRIAGDWYVDLDKSFPAPTDG